MITATNTIEELANQEYRYGFVTDIEADAIPRGLNEGVIRLISAKKNEPEFLLEWRLKAYRHWLTMEEPRWQNVHYPPHQLSEHHLLLFAQGPEALSGES
jgi:Fe-S cluster assembly protein SufB